MPGIGSPASCPVCWPWYGFGEVYDTTDTAKTGFRVGRQEIFFGNDLQVRANVSTNLPSPVFDGFRAYRDWGFARVDAFVYNIVDFENGVLNDRDNPHTNLWGVYGSYDLPKFTVAGADAKPRSTYSISAGDPPRSPTARARRSTTTRRF